MPFRFVWHIPFMKKEVWYKRVYLQAKIASLQLNIMFTTLHLPIKSYSHCLITLHSCLRHIHSRPLVCTHADCESVCSAIREYHDTRYARVWHMCAFGEVNQTQRGDFVSKCTPWGRHLLHSIRPVRTEEKKNIIYDLLHTTHSQTNTTD